MPNVQFFSRQDLEAHRARTASTRPIERRAAETVPTVQIERRPELGTPAPSRLQRALIGGAVYLLAGGLCSLAWYLLLSPAPFGVAP